MNTPRSYRDEADITAMQDVLQAGRKSANGTYYVHTGDLSWWLYYPHLEGAFWEHIYLWDDPSQPGRLLGWTLISPDWVALDVYFQPELRGSPLASEMFAWAEEKALATARSRGKAAINMLWVRHGDDWLDVFLRSRGYALKGGFVYLTRCLQEEIPPAALPAGFTLRSCRGETEVAARAKAQYAAFGSSAPFERYLERFTSFMRSPAYDPERDIVAALPGGEIGAFCIVWTDPVNLEGHFEPVGTHPDYQRRGLGRAVMMEGLRRLQQAGMRSADVAADEDNGVAISLYQSVGFTISNRLGTYSKDVSTDAG